MVASIATDISFEKYDIVQIKNDIGNLTEFSIYDMKKYVSGVIEKMNLNPIINCDTIINLAYPKLKDINTWEDVDNQIINTCCELATYHYEYPMISTYFYIKKLHTNTKNNYLDVAKILNGNCVKEKSKIISAPIVSDKFVKFVEKNINAINNALDYDLDYKTNFFGLRTLEKSYLKRVQYYRTDDGEFIPVKGIVERPQHLWMRVAIAIHMETDRMDKIIETYKLMAEGYFIHATPTLFNAGSVVQQLSSCFLLAVDDNTDSIGDSWKDCAKISKHAGGIGVCMTKLRSNGSYIATTQGNAHGLRVASVYNAIARDVNQSGKRAGSFAIYLEIWHADVQFHLDLRKTTGAETERCRDLFTALVINDLFMKRLLEKGKWSLMNPQECPEILDKYGEDFEREYIKCENEGRYVKQIDAIDLWKHILESQFETGCPYILYKDAVNKKSNQKNIGVINGSNVCIEIVEYHDANEYAVCNLANICLPKFVINREIDYDGIYRMARILTRNLDNIIDVNFYPVDKTIVSNLKHRPIAIGVQGLADVFAMMRVSFDSFEAKEINKRIFETIYFGTMSESCQLAKERGHYDTYIGSPISNGEFQFNMWGLKDDDLSGMWDWKSLRNEIMIHGVRNSLTTACMPTASTSQIQGNNECIEPYTSNIYVRSTNAGEYFVVNKYLVDDLIKINLWNDDIINLIKYYRGSIQKIKKIPENIRQLYKTAWEYGKKPIIEMSAERGPFVDQTQSLNIYIDKANMDILHSCLVLGWKLGLKTGIYYLRTLSASGADKYGIDNDTIAKLIEKYGIEKEEETKEPIEIIKVCPLRRKGSSNDEICEACM